MGCWNESIYGGDAPLEWKENIYELCGVEEYDKDNKSNCIPVETLSKKISDIRDVIDNTADNYKNIGYQVLGAIVMSSGFDMYESAGLRERIIEAIELDEWSKESVIRNNVLKNYKKIVKEYNFLEPINIEEINVFEENDEIEEDIPKEFAEVFGLINLRIKKLKSSIEEKSGVKDFDEGYAVAAQEEIDFLTDFKELMAKQELMGVLLERISNGLVGSSNPIAYEGRGSISKGHSVGPGRGDIVPG